MNFKSALIFAASMFVSGAVSAAVPSGYYSTCENKSGAALLTALNQKIADHTTVSYKGLLDLYKTSDVKPNGKIWDMYSTKEWSAGETCGNYSYVGDCYNREHSFPKSWFNDASPMYSDAFHIYPTDGKVNGQRSNYPYGECSAGTTLPSHNGVRALGKLGKSTFPGYSSTVFEPDDEYKGDFARSYFYMIACYNDRITGWKSDMLAGNKYPGLSTWAVNLLLKWHRQDPVSDKEKNRNEVVYGQQRNRNPFIDYPDLAEHIWGTMKDTPWSSSGQAKPAITLPVSGSTLDFGYTAINLPVSRTISLKGENISQSVTLTVSDTDFSCSPSTISASAMNSGTTVTVTFNPGGTGAASGVLTVSSGSLSSTVNLKAEAVSGIPVGDPYDISSESFSFDWVNIDGPSARYTVNVALDGTPVAGYPKEVSAADCHHTVTGLMPETTYTYQLKSSSMSSSMKNVTTGQLVPWIAFLYDGDLYFDTEPGTPSQPAEIMLDTENISGDITISVTAPFELSTDKTIWTRTLILTPDEDRFYLRLNSDDAGEFTTVIKATAGEYVNDDVEVAGIVSSTPDFVETFEEENVHSGYASGIINGSAADWMLDKVYFNSNRGEAHTGDHSIRFNKSGTDSSIEMATDKSHGAGKVDFYAKAWSASEPGDLTLSYSTDGGLTWTEVKKFTISDPSYKEYSVNVNVSGNIRLEFERTSGGRVCLDDISVANYSGQASVEQLDYHRWDAFSRNGALVIETEMPLSAAVYGTDGLTYFNSTVTSEVTLSLPAGLYIVVIDDFARRVVVK